MELQGFGKGSGRDTNRCDACGKFVKRGLLHMATHYQQHIDYSWYRIMSIIEATKIKQKEQNIL